MKILDNHLSSLWVMAEFFKISIYRYTWHFQMESRRNLRLFRDKCWNSETFEHSNWSDWLEVSMVSDMTVFPTPKMALNWACEILETAVSCCIIYVIQFSNTEFHACHISWFFMIFGIQKNSKKSNFDLNLTRCFQTF